MGHYRFTAYTRSTKPRYLVISDVQRKIIEVHHLAPGADLRSATTTLLGKLRGDGWTIESDARHGFTFVNRGGIRLLVSITERDPGNGTPQSFSPFR